MIKNLSIKFKDGKDTFFPGESVVGTFHFIVEQSEEGRAGSGGGGAPFTSIALKIVGKETHCVSVRQTYPSPGRSQPTSFLKYAHSTFLKNYVTVLGMPKILKNAKDLAERNDGGNSDPLWSGVLPIGEYVFPFSFPLPPPPSSPASSALAGAVSSFSAGASSSLSPSAFLIPPTFCIGSSGGSYCHVGYTVTGKVYTPPPAAGKTRMLPMMMMKSKARMSRATKYAYTASIRVVWPATIEQRCELLNQAIISTDASNTANNGKLSAREQIARNHSGEAFRVVRSDEINHHENDEVITNSAQPITIPRTSSNCCCCLFSCCCNCGIGGETRMRIVFTKSFADLVKDDSSHKGNTKVSRKLTSLAPPPPAKRSHVNAQSEFSSSGNEPDVLEHSSSSSSSSSSPHPHPQEGSTRLSSSSPQSPPPPQQQQEQQTPMCLRGAIEIDNSKSSEGVREVTVELIQVAVIDSSSRNISNATTAVEEGFGGGQQIMQRRVGITFIPTKMKAKEAAPQRFNVCLYLNADCPSDSPFFDAALVKQSYENKMERKRKMKNKNVMKKKKCMRHKSTLNDEDGGDDGGDGYVDDEGEEDDDPPPSRCHWAAPFRSRFVKEMYYCLAIGIYDEGSDPIATIPFIPLISACYYPPPADGGKDGGGRQEAHLQHKTAATAATVSSVGDGKTVPRIVPTTREAVACLPPMPPSIQKGAYHRQSMCYAAKNDAKNNSGGVDQHGIDDLVLGLSDDGCGGKWSVDLLLGDCPKPSTTRLPKMTMVPVMPAAAMLAGNLLGPFAGPQAYQPIQ